MERYITRVLTKGPLPKNRATMCLPYGFERSREGLSVVIEDASGSYMKAKG